MLKVLNIGVISNLLCLRHAKQNVQISQQKRSILNFGSTEKWHK